MEIRNLSTFVHVAELGSFTKAAAVLGYSQSTISFQIKQLEQELDCLLFERINHTISLTQKGHELLVYAQQVTRMTDEFRQSLDSPRELHGHVHIVTPDSICEAMLLSNYEDFYSHYPNITLKFSTADTGEMFEMLARNEADVMFTLDTHLYRRNYIIAKEEPVQVHFVAGHNFPLADRRGLLMRDLLDYPFILTERGEGYRHVFDENLARISLEIEPALEVGRTDIITTLLEKRACVSFLPDFVTEKRVAEGRLVYLDVVDFESNIWKQLIYHRSKWISRAFGAFLDYVMKNEFGQSGCTAG